MAAGEVSAASRGRKSNTPSTSSSRPSSARPLPPKRAHTSAVSTASLRTITKNAAANSANAVNKAKSPLLTSPALARSPHTVAPKTPSPNYFALKVEDDSNPLDSDAGKHAKRNWAAGSAEEDGDVPVEDNPRYESFRRQSERPNHFKLGHSGLSRFSTDGRVPTLKTFRSQHDSETSPAGNVAEPPLSAGGRFQTFADAKSRDDEMEVDDVAPEAADKPDGKPASDAPSYFGLPRYESPQVGAQRPEIKRNPLSAAAPRHSESSLPHSRVSTPHINTGKARAETLPSNMDPDDPALLSPPELLSLMQEDGAGQGSVLLLDLRVSPQYAQARIKGALNLCIPTTLLKRPAFNVQKLTDTFTGADDKAKFSRWKEASHIVVYDASSIQLRDAQSGVNTIKKFRSEGFQGDCYVLKGGFNSISNAHPELIERSGPGSKRPSGLRLPLGAGAGTGTSGDAPQGMQVAGGCPMPETGDQPANPFFGNIRQNMDLIDGVGQMPVKRPAQLNGSNLRGLPQWLREIADEEEEGKLASERFLEIEKGEQKRMQKAYSTQVQYGNTPSQDTIHGQAKRGNIQIAGIEKGTKNRYKDMLPYEHSRVRLRQVDSSDGGDYINASHIKAEWCHRKYISTQAPVPNTFKDFWRMIWEQDVRVIVTLTAQSENGQRKCHPYWEPDTYGNYKIKHLSEKPISLERPDRAALLDPNRKVSMPLAQMMSSKDHHARMQRRATLMGEGDLSAGASAGSGGPAPQKEPAFCTIRKLTLSDVHQPFVPLREIAQVEYTSWPDFGAPAEAGELLSLVETVDNVIRASNSAGKGRRDSEAVSSPTLPSGFGRLEDDETKLPAPARERPVVVHCSAGCGRTGTFVTVDSVVDMLKRQRLVAHQRRDAGRAQSGLSVNVPRGAGTGAHGEHNPFEAAAAQTSPTNLETIVSPTSRMDLDSPKKAGGNRNRFGSIDQQSMDPQQPGVDTDDDDDDDDDDDIEGEGDLDSQDWVSREDIDLVQKTVEELRLQRLSMVQNLRQYTLCYESILEWLVREMPERFRRGQFRQSFQG